MSRCGLKVKHLIMNERQQAALLLDSLEFLPLPQSPSSILDRLQVCSSILNGTLSLRNSGRKGVLSFKSNPLVYYPALSARLSSSYFLQFLVVSATKPAGRYGAPRSKCCHLNTSLPLTFTAIRRWIFRSRSLISPFECPRDLPGVSARMEHSEFFHSTASSRFLFVHSSDKSFRKTR